MLAIFASGNYSVNSSSSPKLLSSRKNKWSLVRILYNSVVELSGPGAFWFFQLFHNGQGFIVCDFCGVDFEIMSNNLTRVNFVSSIVSSFPLDFA